MLNIIISLFLGILLGLISGIVPSLHINLVTIIVLSLLKSQNIIDLLTLIVSLSVSNSFFNTIPLTFFSIPDSPETSISTNPAQKFTSFGKSYEAFLLTIIGSISSLITFLIFSPLILYVYPTLFSFIKPSTSLLLLLVVLFTLIKEKTSRIWALISFLFSGLLGIFTLTSYNIKEPLLPLLSGLFAIPSMLSNLKNKEERTEQKITQPEINKFRLIKLNFLSLLCSLFSTFLPAVGPSQSAVLASSITKISLSESLILTGSLTTLNILFSLITLKTINKSRNGSLESLKDIIPKFSSNELIFSIIISIIVAGISAALAIYFARKFIKNIKSLKLDYLNKFFILLTLILVLIISKPIGILVMLTGTAIGFIPIFKNISRNHLMGCIILPVIFYTLKIL